MSLNHDRRDYRRSIIRSSSPPTSHANSSNPNHRYNKPLINSIVTSNGMSDEEIAQEHQQHLYNDNLMDVDEPATASATTTTLINMERLDDIDTDAAIARQLQEDEYSRESIKPFSASQQQRSNKIESRSTKSNSFSRSTMTDAELAAKLQAEEDEKQQRQRPRLPVPSRGRRTHQINNEPDDSEVIPFPFDLRPNRQRPASAGSNQHQSEGFESVLRRLNASFARPPRGHSRAAGRGHRNIENTSEDFGPDDYERLLELDRAVEEKGLTADQINRLPTDTYRRPATKNDEENKCHICWDQFEQNQTLRRLPCVHSYHKDCIDPWLKQSNICPICRTKIN